MFRYVYMYVYMYVYVYIRVSVKHPSTDRLTAGLFRTAVLQSGSPNAYWAAYRYSPAEVFASFSRKLGCRGQGETTTAQTLDCLMGKDARQLIDTESQVYVRICINIYIYILGVIVSISNTASIITLALPKSDNNNNIYIYIYIYI